MNPKYCEDLPQDAMLTAASIYIFLIRVNIQKINEHWPSFFILSKSLQTLQSFTNRNKTRIQ